MSTEVQRPRDYFTTMLSVACLCNQSTPMFDQIIKLIEAYNDDKKPNVDAYWEKIFNLADSSIPGNLPERWQRSFVSVLFAVPLELVDEYVDNLPIATRNARLFEVMKCLSKYC